jgi:SAM-dependent methyltransferase
MTERTSDADPVAYFDAVWGEHDEANQRWRNLLARNNAEIVLSLVRHTGLQVDRVLDVGCGDAALLAELTRRDLGRSCVAYETSAPIVEFVKARGIPTLERVELFDGYQLAEADDSFDLAMLNFVLEHVNRPEILLENVGRTARTIVVSVILDDTLASRRRAHQEAATSIGRIKRFGRNDVRALIEHAGFAVVAETVRPPSREVMTYWSAGWLARTKAATAAWARHAIFAAARSHAAVIYSLPYYAVCTRRPGASRT